MGLAEHLFDLGQLRPSITAMTSNCSWTCSASGWAKMVRIAAATISWLPFGTTARTLRMKWTRHRCQVAPSSTEPIADFSPVCASLITSCTPTEPAGRVSGPAAELEQRESRFGLAPVLYLSTRSVVIHQLTSLVTGTRGVLVGRGSIDVGPST